MADKIDINIKIKDYNEQTKQKKPVFEAVPSIFDKKIYDELHKYVHIDDSHYTTKKIKPGTQIDLNKIRKMSATAIVGTLTGSKYGDYNEATLKMMRSDLATMKGKELTSEYRQLSEEIKKAENIITAGKRGTAFHKIAELIEKTDLTVEQLTENKLKELEAVYSEIGEGVDSDYTRKRLIQMAKEYEKLKIASGLKGKVTTEKSLGFLAQIGDEIVEIVGTFDSFFSQMGELLDFKTTRIVDPKKIGVQMNLLQKAIELHGGKVSGLKALHIPYRTGKTADASESSLYEVNMASDEEIQKWIETAFAGLSMELPTLLKSTLESYSWGKEGEKKHSWKLNKIPLSKLPKMIQSGRIDEVIAMVEGLSPEDRNHFMNLLWSTKQYGDNLPAGGVESNKLYRKGKEWDALRRALPSFYTGIKTSSGISEESFVDEEGNVSGVTTVGGGSLSQWSKAYRLKLAESGEKAAQTIVDQFIKIIKESTDEIGQDEIFGKLSSLSFKDDIHNQFIDAVGESLLGSDYEGFGIEQIGVNERSKETSSVAAIRSQKRAGERYYREQGSLMRRLAKFEEAVELLDKENPEQIIGFVRGLGSLKHIFQGALSEIGGTEMSQLNEAGIPEFIENSEYLLDRWYEFVATIKKKISPAIQTIKKTAFETKNWSDFNNITNLLNNLMLSEDLPNLAVKTAHKFSWLYQAKDIYDEMLLSELPEGMDIEQYAKRRLTEEQYSQYIGSKQLRAIVDKSGGSLTDLVNNFLKAPVSLLSSELSKEIQDSLFKIKEGSPDLISGKIFDIISEQTDIGGGQSKKMAWWRNINAIERLRRGETIKAWNPRETIEISTSQALLDTIDEKIRKIVDYSNAGLDASAEASKSLLSFLNNIDKIAPYEVRQLYSGNNTDALLTKYGLTPDTEVGIKYRELLAKAKGTYTEKTAWTRESISELFKNSPEKLERALQWVDMYEKIKNLPTIEVGPPKKTEESKEIDKPSDVDTDTIVVGTSEDINDGVVKEIQKTVKQKKIRKKKEKPINASSNIQNVYATSDELADLSKAKATSVTTDYEGRTIGKTYKYLNDKVFADYGSGGLQAWIEAARKGSVKDAESDLIGILTKVPSYKKASGGLSKAGRSAFNEIMSDTFGDRFKPSSGDGAILNELKEIHKDTSSIDSKLGSGGRIDVETPSPSSGGGGSGQTTKPLKGTAKQYLSLYEKISKERIKQSKYDEDSLEWEHSEKQIEVLKSKLDAINDITEADKKIIEVEKKIIDIDTEYRISIQQRKNATKDAAETEKSNIQIAKEYQQYLNQRFNILSKIETAQSKYNISVGKEKAAAAGVVQAGNIELKYLDKKNELLALSMENYQRELKAQMDYQQELKVSSMQQEKLLEAKGAQSLWSVMTNDIQRAAVRITDFGVAARLLNSIPQNIQKIIQYTKELDAAMTNVRIVGGYTAEQAKDLISSYSQIGKTLSATTTEIAEGMNEWLKVWVTVNSFNCWNALRAM